MVFPPNAGFHRPYLGHLKSVRGFVAEGVRGVVKDESKKKQKKKNGRDQVKNEEGKPRGF